MFAHLWAAANFAQLGRSAEAGHHASEVLRTEPAFETLPLNSLFFYRKQSYLDHIVDGMRKAGLRRL